jgi:energy-coupling factor transporter ATP-binding protein EcfA2
MKRTLHRSVPVQRTGRVLQLESLFDVPPSEQSARTWSVELPLEFDWRIGLVVGPSGSGKSTVARELFAPDLVEGYDWPADRAVVDGFPSDLGIKDITAALSSVGFSSPPAWLRPFRCLSNGEQFRATLARALCDPRPLAVVDEFTSVVDRTVAQVGSAAVAKAIRRTPGKKFVAVTCHEDVEAWLDPDWVLRMPEGEFARRTVRRRPPLSFTVVRVHRSAWRLFQSHHYMTADHHPAAYCFCGFLDGRPVVYSSWLHFPHPRRPGWKGHRTVVLPDYQGIGLGNAMDDFCASLFLATGKPVRDTTAHPAIIHHRRRSLLWKQTREAGLMRPGSRKKRSQASNAAQVRKTHAIDRLTCSFEYVGPARFEEARGFGII